jgi:hypothetical protein
MIKYIKKIINKLLKIKIHYFYSDLSKATVCDVLLFCHDNDRGLILNNSSYSPLIDSIFDELTNLNIACQSISLPWSKLGYGKTVNNSLLINRNYLIWKFLKKILRLDESKFYENILNITKARFIIGIGLSPGICLAAKKNKTITIELLHGIGYQFIPWGWDLFDANDLPDKILVLDDVSEKTFKPLERKGLKILKIEHPFYKKISNSKYSVPKEWSYTSNRDKKNILMTLQWGYAGELDEFNGILKNGLFYDEIEKLIDKRPDIYWHFRLHPAQTKGDLAEKIIPLIIKYSKKYSNISWEKSSVLPLAYVALACDLHITMSSMSCYEVSMIGLPSLILCPTTRDEGIHKDYFSDLVREGYAIKKTVDLDFIEKWVDNTKLKPPRSSGFVDNAIWNNLIFEIKERKGAVNDN